LTASTEILVERRDDVLQIPIQANVTIGSKQYAFVVIDKRVEQRAITVGKTNSNFIEILGGVEENEEVVMNPHSHFKKDISDLEEEQAKEAPKDGPKAFDASQIKLPAEQPPAANGGPAGSPERGGRRARPESAEGQPQGPPSSEGRPGGGNFDPMAGFNRMDKDQNGKVTKDEAEGRFAERFDTFDTDADGSVTKEEFQTGFAKLGGGRGGRPRPAESGGN
jgi:hypothetical protein